MSHFLNSPARRAFLQASTALMSALAPSASAIANRLRDDPQASKGTVVVVGGGVGGATAAKYLRLFNPTIKVILIEKNPSYFCPHGAHELLTQRSALKDWEVRYDTLIDRYGVTVLIDHAVGLEANQKIVVTADGKRIRYDALVLSPGLAFIEGTIPGYTPKTAPPTISSDWRQGAATATFARQLQTLREGGVLVLAIAPHPVDADHLTPLFLYERAALITEYLLAHNPRATVMVLDSNARFEGEKAMLLGWNRLYGVNLPADLLNRWQDKRIEATVKTHHSPTMLRWVRDMEGGKITSINPATMRVVASGDSIKADLIHLMPPERAGAIARHFMLTDRSGFCPVDPRTGESTLIPAIYVIGDAILAGALSKNGMSANAQAKITARVIVDRLADKAPAEPIWIDTRYALVARHEGFMLGGVFRLVNGIITRIDGRQAADNVSLIEDHSNWQDMPVHRRLAAIYHQAWLNSFTEDAFG
jgi:sulfide dehydrogenase [flavocytochrome c] flavoprotein subunit